MNTMNGIPHSSSTDYTSSSAGEPGVTCPQDFATPSHLPSGTRATSSSSICRPSSRRRVPSLKTGHRITLLYRVDHPGNPRRDPAEKPALFDRQFVQIPNGRQVTVHLYSMPEPGMHKQAQARNSARNRLHAHPAPPHRRASGADDLRPHRRR